MNILNTIAKKIFVYKKIIMTAAIVMFFICLFNLLYSISYHNYELEYGLSSYWYIFILKLNLPFFSFHFIHFLDISIGIIYMLVCFGYILLNTTGKAFNKNIENTTIYKCFVMGTIVLLAFIVFLYVICFFGCLMFRCLIFIF